MCCSLGRLPLPHDPVQVAVETLLVHRALAREELRERALGRPGRRRRGLMWLLLRLREHVHDIWVRRLYLHRHWQRQGELRKKRAIGHGLRRLLQDLNHHLQRGLPRQTPRQCELRLCFQAGILLLRGRPLRLEVDLGVLKRLGLILFLFRRSREGHREQGSCDGEERREQGGGHGGARANQAKTVQVVGQVEACGERHRNASAERGGHGEGRRHEA
mmetsp:Transcript_98977/g.284416  ORF Transcript_98977/g.284416 Transcript_98977/m.284416 type:complete len:217 (-) Transcript_98977:1228-1878(-)